MLPYILLVVGFAGLIKGADLLVDGASGLAHRFGVSNLVIGLTIVALGTSLPEIFVTILSVYEGKTDLAIGNVLGSNIANILLVLGLAAMITPVAAEQNTIWKEIPFCLLAALLLGVVANDVIIDASAGANVISRTDGLVFLLVFGIFLYYLFEIIRNQPNFADDGEHRSVPGAIGRIVLGFIGLAIGGQWVVDGAVTVARALNMSEHVIGLTLVAVGTSLPELATSIVAAIRKNSGIALGNVVGSNIFNILLVLGIGSMIADLPLDADSNIDIAVVIAATVALFITLVIGIPSRIINRWEGGAFVVAYFVYTAYVLIRN
jgi:cation:H+ antiporter